MSQVNPLQIAVVEDNAAYREELLFYLGYRGFNAWGAASAEAFWRELHRTAADIVLIDIGLPGESGFEVIKYLNELGGYGLVAVTALGGDDLRMRGLALGADLYLVKPVNLARLGDALEQLGERLRLTARTATATQWQLDAQARSMTTPGGTQLPLSQREAELMTLLLGKPGEVFERAQLHNALFRYAEEVDCNRVDVLLSRLRQKARRLDVALPIRSIFGRGIVFVDERG